MKFYEIGKVTIRLDHILGFRAEKKKLIVTYNIAVQNQLTRDTFEFPSMKKAQMEYNNLKEAVDNA